MDVTIRQLEAFVAVASELHFGQAARRLGLSQPTVSQEVRRLERAWGVTLFDRSTRTVRLTRAGQALMAASVGALDQVRAVSDLADLCQRERTNTVRVVVSPSVVNVLLPDVLRDVDRELPGLQVKEIAVESGQVVPQVVEQHADVGIGRFLSAVPGMRWEKLCEEPLAVVLGRQHAAARRGSAPLADLADLPLLLWQRDQAPAYHDRLLQVCTERGLSPLMLVSPPQIVGSRLYLLTEVRAFALVPRSATRSLPPGLQALPLERPARVPLEMLWRDRDPRPWAGKLRELVRHRARDLAEG